jgi:aspartate/methionine/tyrosine aminotransferase
MEVTMDGQQAAEKPSCIGVMDKALALDRDGGDVVHLEKGEPDFDTPPLVVEAAVDALRNGHTRYTTSTGLLELREAICGFYARVHAVDIDPERVIVNSGSSPALLTVLLAVLAPGDEVVLPDPAYSSYRRLVELAGAKPVHVPTRHDDFRYTADAAAAVIGPATKAIIINFPSNPIGSTADANLLTEFANLGPLVISDEVYQGMSYTDILDPTILSVTVDAVALQSFSKAYAMTGWRLGYAVLPSHLVSRVKAIHQDGFVCPNAFVQRAAIAALDHAEEIFDGWRGPLRERRDLLLAGLPELGFEIPCTPDGGFYVFAKLPPGHNDSYTFAARLLSEARVAVVPGPEFGPDGEGYVRLSYATPAPRIAEGLRRIGSFLTKPPSPRGETHGQLSAR